MTCFLCPGPPHILLDLWSCQRSCSCRQSCGSPPVELQGGRPPSTSTAWTWKLPNLPLILPTKMCRSSQWETKCIWSFSKSSLVYNYEKTCIDVSTDPFWGVNTSAAVKGTIHNPNMPPQAMGLVDVDIHSLKASTVGRTALDQRTTIAYQNKDFSTRASKSKIWQRNIERKPLVLDQSDMFPTTFCHFALDRIPLLYNLLPFLHSHFTALDFIFANSRKTWRRYRCSRKCEWKGSALASNPQIGIVAKVKIEMDNWIIFRYRKMYQCRDTNMEIRMVTKKTIEMDWTDQSAHGSMDVEHLDKLTKKQIER